MELKIDYEFQSKIPPLTADELFRLQESILAEGRLINPIVVWNGIIVDGHNRYKFISQHPEIKYDIYEKQFDDRNEAIAWICKNQLGRRNLTPEQKKYLIGKQYEAEKATHGAKDGFRGNQHTDSVKVQNDHLPKMTTRERIAKETNTSDSYVRRAEEYANAVDLADEAVPGIKNEILSGSLSATNDEIVGFAKTAPELRAAYAEKLREPKELKVSKSRSTGTFKDLSISPTPKNFKSDRPTVEDEICTILGALDDLIMRWGEVLVHNEDRYQDTEFVEGMNEAIEELTDYIKMVESKLKK